MTERGLPIVDGAPACPFVAFEDDRDERAASPDHRHRCYAETQPAPRALAHQEAYCLSSAFPVCPTFQDWARREAARSRTDAPRPHDTDSLAAAAAAQQPQRNPPRNWAAPPPWSARSGSGAARDPDWDDGQAAGDAAAAADLPPRGRGLSGSYADRVASDPGMPGMAHELDDDELDEDEVPVGDVPPYAPPRSEPPRQEPRHQQPPTDEPRYEPARHEQPAPGRWDDDDLDDDEAPPEPPVRRRREREQERLPARSSSMSSAGAAGIRHERRRDSHAPEWERARPPEAFPTLRSRRLSELSIPPILVAAVALALAAAVLFALPGLLGFGNPSADESPAPSTALRTELVTPAPTSVPQPTDQVYVVQAGDTLSRIAGRFNITLEELIAANTETLPDPDKLQIGDQLIIPAADPDELPAASEIPAAE